MSLLKRLEGRFSRFAIPNLTLALIVGQIGFYVVEFAKQGEGDPLEIIRLDVAKVLDGEVWRLLSFIFTPPATIPIFVIFAWLLMHLFGSILEQFLGTFRYNLFLLTSFLANLAVAFLLYFGWNLPWELLNRINFGGTNAALYGTLFLGAARVAPDLTLNVFFVLPVRIKWLAIITWLFYGYALVKSPWPLQLVVLGGTLNYFLFFGRGHLRDFRDKRRSREFQAKAKPKDTGPKHECLVCGKNSDQAPKTLFRYCSQCEGQACYCPDHIGDHEHVRSVESSEA